MIGRNKFILLGGAGVLLFWLILYLFMVSPNWAERETVRGEAQGQLDSWLKYYKKGEGTLALPVADGELERELALLQSSLSELRQIEFAENLQGFTLKDAGSQPNNYFDKKRREVHKYATGPLGLTLVAGTEDLGFKGKLKTDPVPLNLTRLYMLRRFLQAAKRAGVKEIMRIQYLREREIVTGEEVAVEGEGGKEKTQQRLFEIPMVIRMRSPEPDFAQLLCEIQMPSDATRSYFCLRGLSVSVREEAQGQIDSQVAVGGLFSENQFLKTLQIPFEDKKKGPVTTPRPFIDPSQY